MNDITGIAPEALFHIGKIAKTYISDGVTHLDDLVLKIQGHLPDVSRDDVLRSLLQKDPARVSKARSVAERNLQAMKTEAGLLLKIDALLRGETLEKGVKLPVLDRIAALKKHLNQLRNLATKSERDGARLSRIIEKTNQIQDLIETGRRAEKVGLQGAESIEIADANRKFNELTREYNIDGRIADLENQIKTGNIKEPIKTERIISDKERLLQIKERDLKGKAASLLASQRAITWKQWPGEILDLMRTSNASMDVSGILRQNGILIGAGMAHMPIKTSMAILRSFKALRKVSADKILNDVINRPDHEIGELAGLKIESHLGVGAGHPDYFMNRIINLTIEKAHPRLRPAVRSAWKYVTMSEQHMVAIGNLIRSQWFDQYRKWSPNAPMSELKLWAKLINTAGGIPDVKMTARQAKIMSRLIWSTRFAVSRWTAPIQPLLGAWSGTNKVPLRFRGRAARIVVSSVAMQFGILMILDAAGVPVDWDKRSRNFLKFKIGDTWYDNWTGCLPTLRLTLHAALAATDNWG
jgi:hypothetical protein